MKKTMRKKQWRGLRGSLNRFIAIFAITAIGAGFYSGVKTTGNDMKNTANQYYQESKLMDIRMMSTMGFTEDDITALRLQPNIKAVMPNYRVDVMAGEKGVESVVAVHALPQNTQSSNEEYLNQLTILSGKLPEAKNECVLGSDADTSYKIGDTITVSESNEEDTLDLFAVKEFTIVGFVNSPSYISYSLGNTSIGNGSVSQYMYVPHAAFDSEYYTELSLTLTTTQDVYSYSDKYTGLVDTEVTALETFGEERAQIRYDDIYDEATTELNDARQELADGCTEADEKLADAEKELNDAEKELADGRKKISDSEKELNDAQAQIDSGASELASGKGTLAQKQAEYEAGLALYNTNKADYDTAVATFNEQKAGYDAAVAQVNAGYTSVASMETALTGMQDAISGMQALDGQISLLAPKEADGSITEEEAAQLEALRAQRIQAEAGLQQAGGGLVQGLQQFGTSLGVQDLTTAAQNAAAQLEAGQNTTDPTQKYTAYGTAVAIFSASLPGVRTGLDTAKQELDAALPELQAGEAALTEAGKQLSDAYTTLTSGKEQLDAAAGQLAGAEGELNTAREQINDGRAKLADAKQELADGEKELADGWQEYNEEKAKAEKELDDAQKEIDDAQKELDDLEKPEWYVFTREDNPSYAGYASDSDRIDSIAKIFPLFFILVAALVCLTTMTRMVEDDRTEIGTLKALGFGKINIAMQYILYAGAASLLGSTVGVLAGSMVFPTIIFNAYRIMYRLPDVILQIHPVHGTVSILAFVLCTTLSALVACQNELNSPPAILMRPKAPKPGKRVLLERITFIWNRLSFSYKVSIRNLFRYKKQFFMTIIGVAGCTALLVTGFGIKDSISGIAPRQFSAVDQYDIILSLTDPSSKEADTPLNKELQAQGQALYFGGESVKIKAERSSGTLDIQLRVAEDPLMMSQEFVHFHTREDEVAIPFPQEENQVVLTEKIAKRVGAKLGDTIEIQRTDNKTSTAVVCGIAENYISNYIYMTPEFYNDAYGEAPEFNQVFLKLSNGEAEHVDSTITALLNVDNVRGAVGLNQIKSQVDDMLGSLDSVIWLLILSAGALAIVVLYNLTNINITERIREIATLKVLGFYPGEVAAYIYRENIILTLIGTAFGLVAGVFLHRYIMTSIEVDDVMFRNVIQPISFVLAALFTILCAVIVDVLMLRKLKNVDMVESLKSAE